MQKAIETLLDLTNVRLDARINAIPDATIDGELIGEFRCLLRRLAGEFSEAVEEGALGSKLRDMENVYSGLERDLRNDAEGLSSDFQTFHGDLIGYDLVLGYPLREFERLCRAYYTIEERGNELITLPEFDWENTRFTYIDDRWRVLSE